MEKTLIIKELKKNWVIQVQVTGRKHTSSNGTSTLATFDKSRGMAILLAGNAFNYLLKHGFFDHKKLVCSKEGMDSLYGVGVEPIAA